MPFVLQASSLSYILEKRRFDQDILGLQIVRGVKEINHALFTDDSLLLGEAFVHTSCQFKLVVDEFCEASASRLNVGKCHLYGWNVSQFDLNAIARCCGFVGSLH
jgi:hypothetical protein